MTGSARGMPDTSSRAARGARGAVDVAIDPGSWTTRVAVRGGASLDMPTVVARVAGPDGRRQTVAGPEALARWQTGGESGGALRPIRGGQVQDWDALEALLQHAVQRTLGGPPPASARAVVAVPSEVSDTERRAWLDVVRAVGLRDVRLVPSGLAAAVGAQLPISLATGSMIVSVGAGRTEVVVCALAGAVVRRTAMVGGEAMDQQLVHWLRRQHNLLVAPPLAERIRIEVGAARTPEHFVQMRVTGRDLATGAPTMFDLHGAHVAEAIHDAVDRIRQAVLDALRETPPELCADLLASGVFMTGGGSRLRELDAVLRDATGLPMLPTDRPELAVLEGLVRLLADPSLLDRVTNEG